MSNRYVVVVEASDSNLCAYAPDVPGCITTGVGIEDTLSNMREALLLHLEGEERPPATTHLGDHLDLDDSAIAVVELDVPAEVDIRVPVRRL